MGVARQIFNSQHSTTDLIDLLEKDRKLMKMIKPFDGYV